MQDEDVWIDAMDEEHRKCLWDLLSEKAKDVDAFVAVSDYFADVMMKKMSLPSEKVHSVYIGVDPSKYNYNKPNVEVQLLVTCLE